jgi:hypothetical protein
VKSSSRCFRMDIRTNHRQAAAVSQTRRSDADASETHSSHSQTRYATQ